MSSYEVAGLWTREYPVDYWEANARKYPHRNALVFGSDRFTWLQAVEAVHKLAAGLVKSGFRKDDIIALHAPNSATLLLLRLAAEKAAMSPGRASLLLLCSRLAIRRSKAPILSLHGSSANGPQVRSKKPCMAGALVPMSIQPLSPQAERPERRVL
ncbi:MAG: AMP-binding protein [Rubrivivax sp.]|nr:AMP-binding protein [Rubrivivax sp.]